MPGYKGHILGATTLYILILAVFSLYYVTAYKTITWLLCVLAGALFPDIDIKSKGQQIFYKFLFAGVLICILFKQCLLGAYISLGAFLPLLCKHRGLFHNLWFLLFITLSGAGVLLHIFPHERTHILACAGFFLLGVISHLWLDKGLKRMLRFNR